MRLVDRESVEYLEIVGSIREHGVLQPILVRSLAEGWWEIIDGMHRWTGACEVGLKEVPAVIRPCSDNEAMALTVQCNALVKETHPCEFANHLRRLMARDPDMKMPRLSKLVGKSPAWIGRMLSLTELPEAVQKAVDRCEIPVQSGFLLAKLPVRLLPQFITRAKTLKASEFRALATNAIRKCKDELRVGRLLRLYPDEFTPRSWLRTLRAVRKESETDEAGVELLMRLNCVTALDGWRAAITWVLNLDPEAIEQQRRNYESQKRGASMR